MLSEVRAKKVERAVAKCVGGPAALGRMRVRWMDGFRAPAGNIGYSVRVCVCIRKMDEVKCMYPDPRVLLSSKAATRAVQMMR